MATKFTYEDFEKEMNKRGMGAQFSSADLNLAKSNPDAGMSLLNYKTDYANATTDEARAMANEGAESIRTTYGGYTGGEDGSSFYLDQPSPNSFSYEKTPTYNNQWADTIKDSYDKVSSFGSFDYNVPAPTYKDSYADERNAILSQLTNPGEFSYDYNSDPVYGAYAKQYRREGERASANALGQTAAATGGMPSSYAVSAAAQAGNYYGSQLADKIPELYSAAYDRWLDQFTLKQSALSALQGESQNEYDRYLGELSQYNNDRNMAYQQYTDEYNRLIDAMNSASAMEQLDYTKYLNDLQQYNTDKNFAYNQLLDEIANQQALENQAYDRAWDAAGAGDFSHLQNYDVDITQLVAEQERANREAALAEEQARLALAGDYADYGDLSRLEEAGVNIEQLVAEQEYNRIMRELEAKRAELGLAGDYAGYGDYSKLGEFGVDISNLLTQQEQAQREAALDEQYRQAQINDIYWTQRYNEQQAAYEKEQDALASARETAETTASADAELMAAAQAAQNGKATAAQYDLLLKAGLIDRNTLLGAAETTSDEPMETQVQDSPVRQAVSNRVQQLENAAESGQLLSEDDFNYVVRNSPGNWLSQYADYAEYLAQYRALTNSIMNEQNNHSWASSRKNGGIGNGIWN